MPKEYYYGSHIPSSHDGIINGIDQIIKYHGNLVQIFLSDPVTKNKIKISDEELTKIKIHAKNNKVKIVIHSPYTLNFAREFNKKSKSIRCLLDYLNASHKLDAMGVVIHSGKFVDINRNEAIENMYKNIKYILDNSNENTKVLLETPCGQGTELGYKLEELRQIYNQFSNNDKKRLRICVDTCHVFAAGYDLSEPKKVKDFITLFDTLIGWNYVDLIHLNDSKTKLESHIDRHACLNQGHIGIKGLRSFIQFVYKANIPLILETHCFSEDILTIENNIK
jgi:deoxyribonuclease-4